MIPRYSLADFAAGLALAAMALVLVQAVTP